MKNGLLVSKGGILWDTPHEVYTPPPQASESARRTSVGHSLIGNIVGQSVYSAISYD